MKKNTIFKDYQKCDDFILKLNSEFYKFTERSCHKCLKSWCYLVYRIFLIFPKILSEPDCFSTEINKNDNTIIFLIKCFNPRFRYEEIKKLGIQIIIFFIWNITTN